MLLTVGLSPATAMGSGTGDALLMIAEPLFPDLRLELATGTAYLVLSLPVHVLIYHEHLLFRDKARYSLFAEPQWRPAGSEWRGVAGIRVTQPVYGAVAVLVDGAGLVGTDGHGGLAGLGAGLFEAGLLGGTGFLALVWRHAVTTTGDRNDFSLDLAYPLWH